MGCEMTPALTIIYLTNRKEPHLEWFLRSLFREMHSIDPPHRIAVELIVVDHFCWKDRPTDGLCRTVAPKPNVWNGPNRLTKEEWFAAGSARNTGICYCRTPWLAFVDDLSVLLPGWLAAAMDATNHPLHITLGAYRKVKKLVVDEVGNVASFEEFPAGIDNRQKHVDPTLKEGRAFAAYGSWLYGCSLVAPLEAFLQINGWPEDISGGIGFEDCLAGVVLENNGWKFRYDTRLMSWESEEDHHVEPPFKKTDKGVSPNDKSHAALDAARKLMRFDNHFDLRAIRQDVLAGHPFPIPTGPKTDWYDGQSLEEM